MLLKAAKNLPKSMNVEPYQNLAICKFAGVKLGLQRTKILTIAQKLTKKFLNSWQNAHFRNFFAYNT